MVNKNKCIEEIVIEADKKPSNRKVALIDIGGNTTYSLIVGTALDYFAGLNPTGIIISRAYGTGMNFVTGGPYGYWREKWFDWTKTKEEDRSIFKSLKNAYSKIKDNQENWRKLKEPLTIFGRKAKKTVVDLGAFNTFQVPIYASAIAIGTFLSEGRVDLEKVKDGSRNLAMISPLIGPTMGTYIDFFRKSFNVKSAAEGAYKK